MAKVKFSRGSQSSYDAIRNHDSDTIYICTNTGNAYLGDTPLFDEDAFVGASLSGKTLTFNQHGDGSTLSSVTVSLDSFKTTAEVQAMIDDAVSALLKFKGSIDPSDVTSSLLVAANEGNVYSLSDDLAITSGNVGLFVNETVGDTLTEGTNIVIVETSSNVFKYDILSGLIDLSGYVEKPTLFVEGNFPMLDSTGGIVDSRYSPASFKPKQTAVSDPTASGNTVDFISNITQNANGVISASKKTVRSASTSQAGIVQLTDSTSSTSITTAATPNSVKTAYDTAAAKVSDVKTGTTAVGASSIVDNSTKVATLLTGTAYNASTNKMATMADVTGATPDWVELDDGRQ